MAPIALENEDHSRDAAFKQALHGKQVKAEGFQSMMSKDHAAHKEATEEYFKHWDNKSHETETAEIREVSHCPLTKPDFEEPINRRPGTEKRICHPYETVRILGLLPNLQILTVKSYYNLATDIYEYGWGGCFHFCRFAYGEGFHRAIARHEHYLAHLMGLRNGMKVLDVGCGVGGPAREIVKFSDVNVVGLNNNDYQIDRAIAYAHREGLSKNLSFVKGDFMV